MSLLGVGATPQITIWVNYYELLAKFPSVIYRVKAGLILLLETSYGQSCYFSILAQLNENR